MKNEKAVKKSNIVCFTNIVCLLVLSLFMLGCSYHDQQFSYFNMLNEQKRTVSNKQAAEKFWSSIRPVSTLSDSFYKLGRHYLQNGEYDKAIAQFSKALVNDAKYCKAYNGLAMAYDAQRSCDPARNAYEQALQCAPDQAYVYNNYGCSSLLCGEYQKGLVLLQKAEKLGEGNARIKNNLRLVETVGVPAEIYGGFTAKQTPALVVAQSTVDQPAELQATPLVASLSEIEPQGMRQMPADSTKSTLLPQKNIPLPDYAKNTIEVSNGNGVTGMAGKSAVFFRGYGFNIRSITNAENFRFRESIIYYKEGYLPLAKELVAIIPGAQNLKKVDSFANASIGVRLLLGRDLVNMHFPESYDGISQMPPAKREQLLASTIPIPPLSLRQY
jgi:tetratricopeptide (TPR) repeat protein